MEDYICSILSMCVRSCVFVWVFFYVIIFFTNWFIFLFNIYKRVYYYKYQWIIMSIIWYNCIVKYTCMYIQMINRKSITLIFHWMFWYRRVNGYHSPWYILQVVIFYKTELNYTLCRPINKMIRNLFSFRRDLDFCFVSFRLIHYSRQMINN